MFTIKVQVIRNTKYYICNRSNLFVIRHRWGKSNSNLLLPKFKNLYPALTLYVIHVLLFQFFYDFRCEFMIGLFLVGFYSLSFLYVSCIDGLCVIFHFSFHFSFNFCFVCFHNSNVLIFYVCINRQCQPKLFKDKITKLSRTFI